MMQYIQKNIPENTMYHELVNFNKKLTNEKTLLEITFHTATMLHYLIKIGYTTKNQVNFAKLQSEYLEAQKYIEQFIGLQNPS